MHRPWIKLSAGATMLTALMTSPGRALGETSEEAMARGLFTQALGLLSQGAVGPACRMLEESLRLDPGMGTRYRLAECHEKLGRLRSAQKLFMEVADAAALARQPEREKLARKRAAGVESRLPSVSVVVSPSTAKRLAIALDSEVLPSARLGEFVQVDPGEHTVTATEHGQVRFRHTMTLAEAGGVTTVEVPELKPTTGMAQPPTAATPKGGARVMPSAPEKGASDFWQRYRWSLTAGGTAVVLAGMGAAMGARTASHFQELESTCGQAATGCSGDIKDSVIREAAATTALLSVAGVAAALSLTLFVVAERKPDAPKAVVSAERSGVVLRVLF